MKPLVERELRPAKDRTSTNCEFQAAVVAFVGFTIGEGVNVLESTMRAVDAIGKALGGKIFNACIFGGELFVTLLYWLHEIIKYFQFESIKHFLYYYFFSV